MASRLKLISIATAAALAFIVPASAASAADGVALRSGTLRAGPGSDFPSVDQISRGEEIQIYGCTEDYAWCDVSNDDNRGWFPGSRIGYLEDGRRVVITEAGPSIGLAILGFSVGTYWGEHYHNRSFYNRADRYERFDRYGPPRGPRPDWQNNRPRPDWQNNNPRPQQPNWQQQHRPDFRPPVQQQPRPEFRPPVQQQHRPEFRPPVQQQPRPEFRPPVQHQPQFQAPRPQPQVQAPRPQPQVQAPRPQIQRPPADQNCGKHCVGQ